MMAAFLAKGCGGSSSGAPRTDAGRTDGGGDSAGQCHDLFSVEPDGSSPAVPCCPEPAPDCTSLADGYPGYHCVDRSNQFCSCSCSQHAWTCGC